MIYDTRTKTWSYPVITLLGYPVPQGHLTFLTLEYRGDGYAQHVLTQVPVRCTRMPEGYWIVTT